MQEEAHVVLAMQHASLNRTSQLGMLHATFLQILSTLFQVTLGVCVFFGVLVLFAGSRS